MTHKPQPIRLSSVLLLIFCTNFLAASEKCDCENDDLYVIRSTGPNGLVLDGTDPGQIRVQQFNGSDAQLWKFQPVGTPGLYYIINEHHGKAMDMTMGDDRHLYLVLNDLRKILQQQWSFDLKGHIVNAVNDRHVDIHKANFTAGNELIVWKDNGCNCQTFILQKNNTTKVNAV